MHNNKVFKMSLLLILFGCLLTNNTSANNETVYMIGNDNMTITFERTPEDFLKITNFSGSSKNWITPDSRDTDFIWQLSLTEETTTNNRSLNSQMVKVSNIKQSSDSEADILSFEWEITVGQSKGVVYADVALNKNTSLSEWSMRVELPDNWVVTDLIFPILNIDKNQGAKLYTSSNWGTEYDLDLIGNMNFQLIYPSSRQTMQVVCMQHDSDVLYFATHDKNANLKTFSVRVGNSVELSTNVVASADWNKNNCFSIPWKVSIGLNNQGWEQALLTWYRPFALNTIWGSKKLLDKNLPEWLLKKDLWLHGGRAGQDEYDIAKKSFDFFGNDIGYHWYYWSSHEFDTDYPEYFPPREGYDRIVDLVHSRGAHIMPYTNGRLWDTTTVSYQKLNGADEVVLRKNLTPYVEVYASKAPLAVVCPTSKVWNDIVVGFASEILSEKMKSDGIYFDQIASARALPCYNENHDHAPGGGDFWHYGNRSIFTNVRKVLKDNQIMTTEQNAECYLDLFDMFLMGNRSMGKIYAPAPLFPLIYSDIAITYGFYLHNPNDMSFRLKNALTVLWGAQLNGGRSLFVMSDRMKENAAFLRDMANFRRQNHDLFVGGRMMGEYTPEGNNPMIEVESWGSPSKAVRGAKWISREGKEAILLVNFNTDSHEIILPDGKKYILKPGGCYRYNP